jgi:TolA-binding protein
MSDTTAFLTGCAVTGIAAVLLGSGLAASQYRSAPPVQPLPSTPALPTVPVPSEPSGMQSSERTFQLERDLEDQQAETSDLKTQLDEQQADIQRLTTQIQEQQRLLNEMSVQMQTLTAQPGRSTDPSEPSRFQTLTLVAIGVTLLIVIAGGGFILIAIVVLLVQSQRRQPRSMQVIHPMPQPYTFPDQEYLPPARTRRTRQIDYYED